MCLQQRMGYYSYASFLMTGCKWLWGRGEPGWDSGGYEQCYAVLKPGQWRDIGDDRGDWSATVGHRECHTHICSFSSPPSQLWSRGDHQTPPGQVENTQSRHTSPQAVLLPYFWRGGAQWKGTNQFICGCHDSFPAANVWSCPPAPAWVVLFRLQSCLLLLSAVLHLLKVPDECYEVLILLNFSHLQYIASGMNCAVHYFH